MRSRHVHVIVSLALVAVVASCTSARRGSKSKDDTSSSDGVDGSVAADDVSQTDTTDGSDAADAVDGTDTSDATDVSDATDESDATDTADASDAADGTDATDASDGLDVTDLADATDGTDGIDGLDGVEAQDGTDGTVEPVLTTITDLQTSLASTACTTDAALVASQAVRIDGAVVVGPKFLLYAGKPGDPDNGPLDGYYLAQGGAGANRGLLLAVPTALGVSLSVGQAVSVEGTHVEYYCLSEIVATKVTQTGNGIVPNPLIVDPLALSQDPEPYEGSLVRLDDLMVTSVTTTEVQLSGGIRVQWKHYPFVWQPTVGQIVESVVGFVDYQYGNYLIQPRGLSDIVLGQVIDPSLKTILAIQNDPSSFNCEKPNGPLVTQPAVKVKGTVISPMHDASKTLDGVWLNEVTPDQATGLYVVFPKTLGLTPKVGDIATFEGNVKEYYCLTELEATSMTAIGTGPLPSPDYVTPSEIVGPGGEYWEGHYVTLSGLTVMSNANYAQYGEIEVSDGLLIDGSDLGVPLPFVPGDSLSVTGVVTYAFSAWRVVPFSAADVVLE